MLRKRVLHSTNKIRISNETKPFKYIYNSMFYYFTHIILYIYIKMNFFLFIDKYDKYVYLHGDRLAGLITGYI